MTKEEVAALERLEHEVRRYRQGDGSPRAVDDALTSLDAIRSSVLKFGIVGPSERPLGLNYADAETWGAEERPVLFETAAQAQARIDDRSKQYPNGDWPNARVAEYTPGVRIYPKWRVLDETP